MRNTVVTLNPRFAVRGNLLTYGTNNVCLESPPLHMRSLTFLCMWLYLIIYKPGKVRAELIISDPCIPLGVFTYIILHVCCRRVIPPSIIVIYKKRSIRLRYIYIECTTHGTGRDYKILVYTDYTFPCTHVKHTYTQNIQHINKIVRCVYAIAT